MPPQEMIWFQSSRRFLEKMDHVDSIEDWHRTLWKWSLQSALATSCMNTWGWAWELFSHFCHEVLETIDLVTSNARISVKKSVVIQATENNPINTFRCLYDKPPLISCRLLWMIEITVQCSSENLSQLRYVWEFKADIIWNLRDILTSNKFLFGSLFVS